MINLLPRLLLIFQFTIVLVFSGHCQVGIGLSFTPGAVHHIKKVDEDARRNDFDLEEPMFGYETGLVVRKGLNRNLSLESGVRYSRLGIKFEADFLIFEDDPRVGKEVTDYVIHRFDFINVPILIQWNPIPDRRFSPIIKAGLQNYFFLEEYVKFSGNTLVNEEDRNAVREWRKNNAFANRFYNPGLSFGVGIQGKVGQRTLVSIMPTINYQLLSVNKPKPPISRYLYLAGVEFMVTYQLNKKKE